ncbi:MAG: hypothetical protein JW891_03625 [Candidatus Lokiarchaeota archaeon]|nr:hypothetical protein [Candidatus Lokiarchaeota archaeon]
MNGPKNQLKENLVEFVIESCKNRLLEQIRVKIQDGLDPFDSYDQALDDFELEEEIALVYDLKAEKIPELPEKMDLMPNEIEGIKKEIEKNLFAAFMKEFVEETN